MLEIAPIAALLEEAAERGFVHERDLEALSVEHELEPHDVDEIRHALEERDVELRTESDSDDEPEREPEPDLRPAAVVHDADTASFRCGVVFGHSVRSVGLRQSPFTADAFYHRADRMDSGLPGAAR